MTLKPFCDNEACKQPNMRCFCTVSVRAPLECYQCARSRTREDIYAEIPIGGDWDTGGFIMRVGCVCDACMDESLEKDDTRTEFEPYENAIGAWNLMQVEIEERQLRDSP